MIEFILRVVKNGDLIDLILCKKYVQRSFLCEEVEPQAYGGRKMQHLSILR